MYTICLGAVELHQEGVLGIVAARDKPVRRDAGGCEIVKLGVTGDVDVVGIVDGEAGGHLDTLTAEIAGEFQHRIDYQGLAVVVGAYPETNLILAIQPIASA